MNRRDVLISAVLVLLCAGILVLFTDIELTLVRWDNCGPFATQRERSSELCH